MSSSPIANHRALRSWVEIDLAALDRNIARIRRYLPPYVRHIAVVKADAYGHGMPSVILRLLRAGVDAFGVANVQEGLQIREQDVTLPVLILSPVLPDEIPLLFEYQLTPFVSSVDELAHLQSWACGHERIISVHLKIDTGMGRAGFWYEDPLQEEVKKYLSGPWIRLTGIATHFSCVCSDKTYTKLQRQRFHDWLGHYGCDAGIWIHESSSFALQDDWKDSPCNAARIGALQYGVGPDSQVPFIQALALEPILSFYSRVSLVKMLPVGVPVGYDAMAVTRRPTRIAVLSAGYADGISTSASNRAEAMIYGQRFRVFGRVAMDQAMLDITDAKVPIHAGDRVTWIGRDGENEITANEFCYWSNHIIRECLCSISARVQRVYK
ncbi:MAG: alanine racemase [Puniceicoccales bacterium]|jgi:alanine racemase|nr:alanine racemase [Puniceicoccales bacterium]